MSLQTGKKTTNKIKLSPSRIIPHFSAPLVILALMFSGLWGTAARASTLQDFQPEASTTCFGQCIAVISDITGDGIPDLIVGGPFHDSEFSATNGFGPPQDVGRVFLVNGATLGEITELNDPFFQQVLNFPKFGGEFGFSVAALGDINHDGVPDILVGVPHHSNFTTNSINCGEAFVFSGADHSILFTINDPNESEGNRFGYAVAGLGDVNGDGVPDMIIGVPKYNASDALPDVGTAYIFSGADGSLIRQLNSPDQILSGRFASAVANAGDVDHDGVNDIIIGAPGSSRAYVFSGRTGPLLFTILSPATANADKIPSFGYAVAGGLDVNNDGTPDFVIGAPSQNSLKGGAYVFSGSNGALLYTLRGPRQTFAKFGKCLSGASQGV